MSLLRSVMSVNFSVNEKGETTFFFPVVAGVWCPRKGYRITSDEDVKKLRRYLSIHFGIVILLFGPVAAIVGVRVLELTTLFRIVAFVFGCVTVVAVQSLVLERLVLRRVVDKYERTKEKPGVGELQRLAAMNQPWDTLIILAVLYLLFFAFGLFGLLSGYGVPGGIALVIIFSLAGAQLAHQIVLKRQGVDAPDRE